MTNVSFFEGGIKNAQPSGVISLEEVASKIKTSKELETRISIIRRLEGENQKREKSALPYVTFSGTFSHRSASSLVDYSGLVCMDIDDVPYPVELKEKIAKDERLKIQLMFISPSGKGLKIVLPTNGKKEDHEVFFEYYKAYFFDNYGIEVDKSGKDIPRACFLSYDPELVYNEFTGYLDSLPNISSTVGEAVEENGEEITAEQKRKNVKSLMFFLWKVRAERLQVVNDYQSYFEFVSSCAKGCGEQGRDYCREICQRSLKYDADAFEKLYSDQIDNPKNTYTFGTARMMINSFSTFSTFSTRYMQLSEEDWTFENRPSWIPKSESKNEEICYIMGFLTSVSAVMPHVYFWHNNQKYYLNFYTIIQGKLASGKSKATQMSHSIDLIDGYIRDNSDSKLPHCIKETGNITDAMLIFDMARNQENPNKGSMLIQVSEIDVMSQKKKIGLSSENTRLAWGHETISCKRKGMDTQSREEDRKGYIIKEPRISLLLTGTPSQLPAYFTNNCDGNLSRYLIYTLDDKKEYVSGLVPPSEDTQIDYTELCRMWGYQMAKGIQTQFLYTDSQKEQLDNIFSDYKKFFASANDDFHNYINRMPIAVRRIAGVLTTLRYWERKETTEEQMYASDEDWALAIQLVLNSMDSLYRLYNSPAISKRDVVRRQAWVDLLNQVPHKFETPTFLNVAVESGYTEGTARDALTYLRTNNYVRKIRNNHYEKLALL